MSNLTIIDKLPSETVTVILSYLSIAEIVNMSLVCRSLHSLISPSLSVDQDVNEYSVDVWREIINQFKRIQLRILSPNDSMFMTHPHAKYEQIVSFLMEIKTQNLPTVVKCKELFIKLLCMTRVCRSCEKELSTWQEVIEGSIISCCNCRGYICSRPCLNRERIDNHSITTCSSCNYKYTIKNDKNGCFITRIISQHPLLSIIIISLAAITPLYLIMAALGEGMNRSNTIPEYCMHNIEPFWAYMGNIVILKYIPLWKVFTKGMIIPTTILQSIIMVVLVIVDICQQILSIWTGNATNNYMSEMELETIGFILALFTIIAIPVVIVKLTDLLVTTLSVRHLPVQKKSTIQQQCHHMQ